MDFFTRNGKHRPISDKKIRDISDDDVNVEINIDPVDVEELEAFARQKGDEFREEYGFELEGNYARCKTCGWIFNKDDGETWNGLKEHEQDHRKYGDRFVRMAN